jgi:hypothetical protein
MARIIKKGKAWKHLLKDARDKIGTLVVKQYKNRIVIASYSERRSGKASPLQQDREDKFKEAVTYAKKINSDPAKKAAYEKYIGTRTNVYQAALSEYLKGLVVEL